MRFMVMVKADKNTEAGVLKSKEEAIEWVKRCPNPLPDSEAEIEIRQVFEAADFGEAFTPELRKAEERVASQAAANAKR